MRAKGRRLGLLVLLGCAGSSGLLSGCGIGIAGLFLALSDQGDDGNDLDAPATVTFEGTPRALGSPDQVEIRYKVRNDDAGNLSARIAVLRVQVGDGFQVVRDPRGEPIPLGDPVQALPVPGSTPAEALPNDVFVSFVWDVKQALGEDSAMVEVLATPVEDGKEGRPERSALPGGERSRPPFLVPGPPVNQNAPLQTSKLRDGPQSSKVLLPEPRAGLDFERLHGGAVTPGPRPHGVTLQRAALQHARETLGLVPWTSVQPGWRSVRAISTSTNIQDALSRWIALFQPRDEGASQRLTALCPAPSMEHSLTQGQREAPQPSRPRE